jgi:hypothetical protein
MESNISVNEAIMEKIISIVIPVHDKNGEQLIFLNEALNSVAEQNELPHEVIISAGHRMHAQSSIISNYKKILPIKVLINQSISASSNLNFAIPKSKGQYIKILFQDDLLTTPDYLHSSKLNLIDSQNSWGIITKSIDYDSRTKSILKISLPKYSVNMLKGVNLFGSPSAVLFRKKYFLPFREDLLYLYDAEWYVRMVHNWGMPLFSRSIVTLIRRHKDQSTHKVIGLLPTEIKKSLSMHDCSYLNHLSFKYLGVSIKCKCKLRK